MDEEQARFQEEDGQERTESPRPLLQAGEVQARARTRHSLPGRLARAARAALQSHFPLLPTLKTAAAASRIPLEAERATGLFRSGALETHISRALGNTLGLNDATSKESWILLPAAKIFPAGARAPSTKEDHSRQLQLSGKHSVGTRTMLETLVQGTKVSLLELQLRAVHTLINPQNVDHAQQKEMGRIAFSAGTDVQSRHRLTLESTIGSVQDKHSWSTVLSSDLYSRLSWGLSSSVRVDQKLTLFTRFNSDAHVGGRVVLQAVQRLDEKNTVSPICAATLGSQAQAGVSWTHSFTQHGIDEESLQVKALHSSNGAYAISLKMQFGDPTHTHNQDVHQCCTS